MFLNYSEINYFEIPFCKVFAYLACGNGYCELVPHLTFCSNIVHNMMCQHEKVHLHFYLALIGYKILCVYVCN